MKKLLMLVLIVALAMTFSLIGCKAEAADEEVAATDAADDVEVETTEAADDVVAEDAAPTYTFHHMLWMQGDANTSFHTAAGEAYMAINSDVAVEYSAPEPYDPVEHAAQLDTIIAGAPDAIFLHLSDVDTLLPSLQAAADAGIPVGSVTSHPPSEEANAKIKGLVLPCWVGSDEALIGGAMGEYLLGILPEPQHVIYLITTPGHAGHEARAEAFFAEMPAGTVAEKLETGSDPEEFKDILTAYLTENPDVDCIFGMILCNKWVADVLDDMDKKGEIIYFTSDENPSSLDGIKQGYITATFTQEFPIQGLLAYHIMYLYLEYAMAPIQPIITGPAIVDASNVDVISELVLNALGQEAWDAASPFAE